MSELDESRDFFSARMASSLRSYGSGPLIEFERQWFSGDDIVEYADRIDAALTRGGVEKGAPIGLVVRNRVPHAAAILGSIATGRPVAMIYSYQSDNAIGRDIEDLQVSGVVLDVQDWTTPVAEAVSNRGAAAVALSLQRPKVKLMATQLRAAEAACDPSLRARGLHILTSGTTGLPKRIPIKTRALHHAVASVTAGDSTSTDEQVELVCWPFSSIGVCQLLAAAFNGKPMVLLEKFSVQEWTRAVWAYRIKRAGVQPAMLRMLLDSDVTRTDLSSLEYLMGGSGPLDTELRKRFEARFGIPLLWGYGATEFAGSVCAWTPDLHREWATAKPDTVGRPLPNVGIRIVDSDTGLEVETGEVGILEGRVDAVGPDWIRTTDLASVDVDGFVTLRGRADGAINRGGFKILPEAVRKVLISHPAVGDACVVGVPDQRLGQVPFAAVEPTAGAIAPTETELQELVGELLPRHHIPVGIKVVEQLPRNASLKVVTRDIAALYKPNCHRNADGRMRKPK